MSSAPTSPRSTNNCMSREGSMYSSASNSNRDSISSFIETIPSANPSDVIFESVFYKLGTKWKKWYKRLFRLDSNGCLAYYNNRKKLRGSYQVNYQKFHESWFNEKKRFVLIIQLQTRKLKLEAPNRSVMEKFKTALRSVGCEEIDDPTTASAIETKDVEQWTSNNIQEWLSCIYCEGDSGELVTMLSVCGDWFEGKKLDGKQLLELSMEDMLSPNENDEKLSILQAVKLKREIEKLRKKRTFSKNFAKIYQKIERLPNFQELDELDTIVNALSDKDQFRKTYLNIEQPLASDVATKLHNEDSEGLDLTSSSKVVVRDEVKLSVKLVISELLTTESGRNLRRIISPLVSKIPPLTAEFGIFHSALVVGPFYLEWTNSSLCIPKRIAASMSILSADIGKPLVVPKEKASQMADQLADLIIKWNANYYYKLTAVKGKKTNEANCQEFVDAVLDTLGLKMEFSECLQNFLKNMKVKGVCEMNFTPSQQFIKAFDLPQSSYVFENHGQLDEFVAMLKSKNETFRVMYPNEVTLLKSFDRAFWLRHYSNPDDPKFHAHTEGSKLCCPFDDPKKTASYL